MACVLHAARLYNNAIIRCNGNITPKVVFTVKTIKK